MEKFELSKIGSNLLLRDRAYEIIKEGIIIGYFKPGQELTEQYLSEELGISKTPIRDALRQLQVEGFVRLEPFKGAVVTEINRTDIHDILQLRLLLEPYAASVAATKISDDDLNQLNDVLTDMMAAFEKNDLIIASEIHKKFHSLINRKVGNQRVEQILDNLGDHMERFTIFSMKVPSNIESSVEEYKMIMQAMLERSPALAEEAMRKHIINVKKRFENNQLLK